MSHKKIEKAINKWFEGTQKLITEVSSRDKSHSLLFCAFAITVMKTYCRAAVLLLDEGFKLPAMALIRVISEFFIKFLWCVVSPDDENEIHNRLRRWDRNAGNEKINLYNGLLELEEGVLNKEDLKKIKKLKEQLERTVKGYNAKKERLRITGKGGLFESTSNIFGGNVSAILYSQYCPAVHIDPLILSSLKQGEINDDTNENLGDLKMRCLNFAYMFLLSVHVKKNWGKEAIEQEYNSLIDDLSTKD
ncbi:MAG: DUF5677 domain-containing protein [Phycisphaerae bacterium]|jgi:hypothetical protein